MCYAVQGEYRQCIICHVIVLLILIGTPCKLCEIEKNRKKHNKKIERKVMVGGCGKREVVTIGGGRGVVMVVS